MRFFRVGCPRSIFPLGLRVTARPADASNGYPALRTCESITGVAGRFGSRQLAVAALQMRDTIPTNNKRTDKLPRFAILRWLDQCGHSKVLVFGPEGCLSTEAARFLTC